MNFSNLAHTQTVHSCWAKSRIQLSIRAISLQDFESGKRGQEARFPMGLATYDDGLPNTPNRVMGFRFGRQITDGAVAANPVSGAGMATSCTMTGTSIAL
jgi:hypothetical protein